LFAVYLVVLLIAWIFKLIFGKEEQTHHLVDRYARLPKTRSSRCFNYLRDKMLWNTTIRFFLEGYIDFALVSLVQMYDLRLLKS